MKSALVCFLSLPLMAGSTSPVESVWLKSPPVAAAARAIAPEVQDVVITADRLLVRSAGLSLHSFGPLQAGPLDPGRATRAFEFAIPRHPRRSREGSPLVAGPIGVFLTGVPIYSAAGETSYQEQNLWRIDAVAAFRATGRSDLLNKVLGMRNQHSPLIGYALDGFPVYGPYGWDSAGRVIPLRSSYQLRKISTRRVLPDGTDLPPGQEGPQVDATFPLGAFAEDYEYVEGSGDLDRHNGRFARTPEYPEGTYAYFLATDSEGNPAYPYLIGDSFAGVFDTTPRGLAERGDSSGLHLFGPAGTIRAEVPETWLFEARAQRLEKVHEKALHVLIVSKDLTYFDHEHPTALTANCLSLTYSFPHAGDYWIFADFTPAGSTQTIARFEVSVQGKREISPPSPTGGLQAALTTDEAAATGRDITLRFHLSIAGNPVEDLDPYLGAWAHIMAVREDGGAFIHAHPQGPAPTGSESLQHTHAAIGASPSEITTTTGFQEPGNYKVWLQVQRYGQVLTFPFDLKVRAGNAPASNIVVPGAIVIEVTDSGYSPARIAVPAGRPIRLAFHRRNAQNCAGKLVFPVLGIEKDLPAGQTTLVELPAMHSGQFAFACGMGMFRGAVVVQNVKARDESPAR